MARYVDAIDLPLPIEDAFDYLADFSRTAEWDPGVLDGRRLTPGEVRLGSRFQVSVSFLGRRIPFEYRITEFERPSRLVLAGGDSTLRSVDEITFVSTPGGTRVTYEARLELGGIRRLADPILDLLFQRIGRAAVEGLRKSVSGKKRQRTRAAEERPIPSRRKRPSGGHRSTGALIALCLAVAGLSGQAASAAEIEGVRFDESLSVGDAQLQLHGTGLMRYGVLIKAFVAALYLSEPAGEEGTPSRALADVPRRLEIEYFWSIPADDFASATVEGISRSTNRAAFEKLRDRVDKLNAMYEDIEPGDRYALTYAPGMGTELALNGRSLGVIEGADFSSALFAIWLGDRALDDSLRKQLLEGP